MCSSYFTRDRYQSRSLGVHGAVAQAYIWPRAYIQRREFK